MSPEANRGLPVALLLIGVLALPACEGEPEPPSDEAPAPVAAEDAPPGTDIWLAPLSRSADGALVVGPPENVTRRPGYDNQPHFLPDGSGFWYTVIDDIGQADIWRYDLAERRSTQVTTSAPESEYSATPLPGGSGFSAIRVEADSTQRLWRFDADGGQATVILPDLAPVGYHAWSGSRTLALFVLGSPATLRLGQVGGGAARVLAEDIGRSLQPIPGSDDVSWVLRTEGATEIRRLDTGTGTSVSIAPGLDGGDFHAWTPDGTLLQASGPRLFAWDPSGAHWTVVVDLSERGLTLSRLAVSPDGTLLALVAEVEGMG